MLFELKHIGVQVANREILKDVNLVVTSGDHIMITGPSGSGKSTLMQLLATLKEPTTGEITYLGKNLQVYDPIEYRREVVYCVQQPTLFGDTVFDNFQFPFQIRKQKVGKSEKEQMIAALDSVELTADFLNRPITELSGGEKQRIALMRNVLFHPRVLLLDEVTTGLDDENKQIVHQLITKFNREQQMTIIQISHDAQEIADASHLIQVVDGQVTDLKGVKA